MTNEDFNKILTSCLTLKERPQNQVAVDNVANRLATIITREMTTEKFYSYDETLQQKIVTLGYKLPQRFLCKIDGMLVIALVDGPVDRQCFLCQKPLFKDSFGWLTCDDCGRFSVLENHLERAIE